MSRDWEPAYDPQLDIRAATVLVLFFSDMLFSSCWLYWILDRHSKSEIENFKIYQFEKNDKKVVRSLFGINTNPILILYGKEH